MINGITYEVRIQALSGEGLSEWSPISEITIHWRETVFDDELMTTRFNRLLPPNPLSAITIQVMADIGYRVGVTQAESYKGPFLTPLAASAPVVRASEEDAVPLTCIVEGSTAMPDKPATIILEVKPTVERE